MKELPLTPVEAERLQRICEAASAGSWDSFQRLTDDPFSNEETMRDQFDGSAPKLEDWGIDWDLTSEVRLHADGTRLVFARLAALQDKRPIILTLHSQLENAVPKISIWTFYYDIDWDAFFAPSVPQ